MIREMSKADFRNLRSVFVSDLHIGSRGFRHREFHDFLDSVKSCENLFLLGDILDGWRLRKNFFFPQSHLNVIRKFLTFAKNGKNVIYIPGNHDEFLREFHEFDLSLGNLKVVNKYEYETVRGERYLLVHGDAFDVVTRYHKWIALLGDVAYDFLLWLNRHFNSIRQMLGFKYWSLSKFIKQKTKQAVSFIGAFEDVASRSAKRYDGIMCGHIHKASLKQFDHFLYMNTGDWVESCTAIIEYLDGSFALIEYQEGVYVILEEW